MPEVQFSTEGRAGRVHLNKPESLNALTANMCVEIRRRLQAWEADDSVRVVVVTAEGKRAFCAGGDVLRVHRTGLQSPARAREFFVKEYRMDAAIAAFSKPFVSLVDGIVMGGGLGVSVNGRYRVVGERVAAAMPETGIGLLPDVGATVFLNACPGRLGLYLGLTGERIGAADMLYAGLATHFVAGDRHAELIAALARDSDPVEDILARFAGDPGDSGLAARRNEIDRLFGADDVEEILDGLDGENTQFAAAAAAALRRMSPTSMKITARQLTAHAGLSVREALALEYRMICRVLERHDFYEGIRAALIDKDRNPRWKPVALRDVTPAEVDAHFATLGEAELSFD